MKAATTTHSAPRTTGCRRSRPSASTERDAEEGGRGGRVRERGGELPERAGALREGVGLPHQAHDTEGGGHGDDADQRQRDPSTTLIVERLDHEHGGEEAEHGRAQRQEGGWAMHRDGPHEPPQGQPTHRRRQQHGHAVARRGPGRAPRAQSIRRPRRRRPRGRRRRGDRWRPPASRPRWRQRRPSPDRTVVPVRAGAVTTSPACRS